MPVCKAVPTLLFDTLQRTDNLRPTRRLWLAPDRFLFPRVAASRAQKPLRKSRAAQGNAADHPLPQGLHASLQQWPFGVGPQGGALLALTLAPAGLRQRIT